MKFRGQNKISNDFNLSSMTDIVFLLLIFFMIASTLAKELDTIEVNLPSAKGKTENRKSITVSINNQNDFFIDGQVISKDLFEKKLIDLISLKKNKIVVLKSEKTVPLEEVVFIMNIANQNAIKIILAVESN